MEGEKLLEFVGDRSGHDRRYAIDSSKIKTKLKWEPEFTFEEGLKYSLRQDPDIIMIGEIRDEMTAKIALEAAYTGHLILFAKI